MMESKYKKDKLPSKTNHRSPIIEEFQNETYLNEIIEKGKEKSHIGNKQKVQNEVIQKLFASNLLHDADLEVVQNLFDRMDIKELCQFIETKVGKNEASGYLITLIQEIFPKINNVGLIEQKENIQTKESFLKELKEIVEKDSFIQLLEKGKVKQAKQEILLEIGKKQFSKIEKKINQFFQQKQKTPIKQAKFLKRNSQGINLFKLPFNKPLKHLKVDEVSTVLIVGMTGVGKSTFINSIANVLLGVEINDDFRYILIEEPEDQKEQKKSITKQVTIYGIPKIGQMKKALQLIDVPGLGDTSGIQRDDITIKMIADKIKTQVQYINKILYVFRSNDMRITTQCQYVIGRVMGLFGRDLASKFLFVFTFADVGEPKVKASIEQSFDDIIPKIPKPWYIVLNNSALFMKIHLEDPVQKKFFEMGVQMIKIALKMVFESSPQLTELTIQVNRKREAIQNTIINLNEKIQGLTCKQQDMRNLTKTISGLKACQLGAEDKIYIKTTETVYDKVSTDKPTTTCMDCFASFTCHKECSYSDNQDKKQCIAMDENGKCTQCPNKCNWQRHKNMPYIMVAKQVEKTITNEELLNHYNITRRDKTSKQQLLKAMMTDYYGLVQVSLSLCKELQKSHIQLSKIELRKVDPKTIIQYLKQIIEVQLTAKKGNYLQKVKQLRTIKQREQAKIKYQKGQKAFMQQYLESQIDSFIPDRQVKKSIWGKLKSIININ